MPGLLHADDRPLPRGYVSLLDPDMEAAFDDAAKERFRRERAEWEAAVAREVEEELIPEYPQRKRRSASTLKTYRRLFSDFKSHCAEFRLTALPTRPQFVAAYLRACVSEGLSRQQIGKIAAAIKYAHEVDGHADPTTSDLVDAIITSLNISKRKQANGHDTNS